MPIQTLHDLVPFYLNCQAHVRLHNSTVLCAVVGKNSGPLLATVCIAVQIDKLGWRSLLCLVCDGNSVMPYFGNYFIFIFKFFFKYGLLYGWVILFMLYMLLEFLCCINMLG